MLFIYKPQYDAYIIIFNNHITTVSTNQPLIDGNKNCTIVQLQIMCYIESGIYHLYIWVLLSVVTIMDTTRSCHRFPHMYIFDKIFSLCVLLKNTCVLFSDYVAYCNKELQDKAQLEALINNSI